MALWWYSQSVAVKKDEMEWLLDVNSCRRSQGISVAQCNVDLFGARSSIDDVINILPLALH